MNNSTKKYYLLDLMDKHEDLSFMNFMLFCSISLDPWHPAIVRVFKLYEAYYLIKDTLKCFILLRSNGHQIIWCIPIVMSWNMFGVQHHCFHGKWDNTENNKESDNLSCHWEMIFRFVGKLKVAPKMSYLCN